MFNQNEFIMKKLIKKVVSGMKWTDEEQVFCLCINCKAVQAKANAKLMVNSLMIMEKLNEARLQLAQLRRSMTAHPDCTEGSEFDYFSSSSQKLEDEIEQLIKEITE